ncbi:MAG: flagellar FlbD family protein [Ignavibacteria bacterium]|nr:flagellar FlbD family protein [Ignavibacteria bacterium]
MILVTKLDGQRIVINAEEIETVEIGIQSVISLRTGKKFIVQEDYKTIVELVLEYKRKCNQQTIKLEDSNNTD